MAKSGPKSKPAIDRFWQMIEKQPSGCWLWGGPKFGNKYGQLLVSEKEVTTAHRFSWRVHKGEIPRGKYICHKCDVRNCVNPDHIYVGDHEDNTQDSVSRGLYKVSKSRRRFKLVRRGELPKNRILTREQAEQIRKDYAAKKFNQAQLAARYGVSQPLISKTILLAIHEGAVITGQKRKGHFRRKLAVGAAEEIVKMYLGGGFTQKQLAEQFGCDQTYVSALVKRAEASACIAIA